MVVLAVLIKRLVKILKSESKPGQIAGGVVLGMMLGLLTFKTLFAVPIILVVILIRVNLASVLFSILFFRLLAYFIDIPAHYIGYFFLVELKGLHDFWKNLYSIKLMPYTRFNNTVVFGNLIISVILTIPIFVLVKRLVINYREKYEEKIKKWKIIKILSGTKFIKWISGIKGIGV